MSEEKKDSKDGEQKQPSGTGQPEKKEVAGGSDKDEKVTISKTELEKLQRDSKDKEGLIEAKRKAAREGRTIPGAEAPAKNKSDDEEDNGDEEFVTKKDFAKNIEKSAIREAQKDPEIDDNWDSIMEFYQPRHGKDTVDDILSDIQTAKKVWKAQNPTPPAPEKKGEGDAKVISDLATDKGLGEGKDKKPAEQKKSILKKNKTLMKDWY